MIFISKYFTSSKHCDSRHSSFMSSNEDDYGGRKKKVSKKIAASFAQLKDEVIQFIHQNGIASMGQVFDIATTCFKRLIWSTPKLEEIAKFLVKECNLFPIDLQVPHKTPVMIYPGHHKCTSTTFFVFTKEDQSDDVQKATNILKDLTDQALAIEKERNKKKKPKTPKTNSEEQQKDNQDKEEAPISIIVPKSKNSTGSVYWIPNGYIPMKKIQHQLLHYHIIATFGENEFTFTQLISTISFDLFVKIAGVTKIPKAFIKEPRLRHLLVRFLPKQILTKIQYSDGVTRLKKTFDLINVRKQTFETPLFYLIKKDDRHRLLKEAIFEFDSKIASETLTFQMDLLDFPGAYEYWKMLQAIELLKNIDPHSHSLWLKHYSFNRHHREDPTTISKAVIEKTIVHPYKKTFPMFYHQVEKFIASNGINWISFYKTVCSIYKGPRHDNLRKLKWPRNSPLMNLVESDEKGSRPNPKLYLDTIENFDNLVLAENDVTVNFNYLAALSNISPTGIIVTLPRPWLKCISLINQVNNVDATKTIKGSSPHNLHQFLTSCYRDYRDLFTYNLSSLSYGLQFGALEDDVETIEITSSQYNQLFHVFTLSKRIDVFLGELIERVRILSLTPSKSFILRRSKYLLAELDNSRLDDSIFYLKLSKFFTQTLNKDGEPDESTSYKCTKKFISEFRYPKPISFYSDMVDFHKRTKDPTKIGSIYTTSASCSFFLNLNCPISLSIKRKTQQEDLSMQSIIGMNQYSLSHFSEISSHQEDTFDLNSTIIGLPNLPDLADFQFDFSGMTSYPRSDFRSYPGDMSDEMLTTYMQLFVIAAQSIRGDVFSFQLILRLVYTYVVNQYCNGASLAQIFAHFSNQIPQTIYEAIKFLEQFQFIFKIHSLSLMPHYIADEFSRPHYIPLEIVDNYNKTRYIEMPTHIWTTINGNIDKSLISRFTLKALDYIELNPGIDILELSRKMPTIPISDLLKIVEVLELDESIYSVYIKEEKCTLFDKEQQILVAPFENNIFMYQLNVYFRDPSSQLIMKRLYPVVNSIMNASLTALNYL